jgi:iron complex transport system ATP-binding protein
VDLAIQLCDEIIVFSENKVVQDQPCNLIADGTFANLFQNENIIFDATIGKFKIV